LIKLQRNKVYNLGYEEGMAQLEDESIDMIMTSPPYWQSRNYGFYSTLGLEKSPDAYVENLRPFFKESMRVLKPTGGLWFNIGDSRSQGNTRQRGRRDTDEGRKGENFAGWTDWDGDTEQVEVDHGIPKKSFMGIPEKAMFVAMEEEFIVRNKIVWAKGAMKYDGASYGGTTPAPFLDNFAVCWEPVYYLTKSRFNYFNMDASRIPAKKGGEKAPLNVWVVPPSAGREKFSYKDQKNFATYPPALVDIAIKAGCPPWTCYKCGKPFPMSPAYKSFKYCEHVHILATGIPAPSELERHFSAPTRRGVILDPFAGSGTTAISAIKHKMDYILFDISPEQCEFAEARIEHVKETLQQNR
jgi:DNA modification methylase